MKFTKCLIIAAAAVSFAACDTSSDYKEQYLNIVTLDASNSSGSVLSYQTINDSPLITLTTTQGFSENQVGKRVVILYTGLNDNFDNEKGGPVNILSAAPTFGGGEKIKPASVDTLDNWASNEIAFVSPFRSGKYLNLPMAINTAYNLKKFACYYDVTTIDSAYPEVHLIMQTTPGYESAYSSNFYGSYDMSDIWFRPSVLGIKVFYNGDKSVTLEKNPTSQTEQ